MAAVGASVLHAGVRQAHFRTPEALQALELALDDVFHQRGWLRDNETLRVQPAVQAPPWLFSLAANGWHWDSALLQQPAERGVIRIRVPETHGARATADTAAWRALPVKLLVERPIAVLQHEVLPGQPLAKDSVAEAVQTVAWSQHGRIGPAPADGWQGFQARTHLHPGEILDARKLARTPVVRRNALVQVTLSNGQGLDIAVQAVALEDGVLGQAVRCRQGGAQAGQRARYFVATVKGHNLLEAPY
jgi:flagella basal body P-ring formation protein FlgA